MDSIWYRRVGFYNNPFSIKPAAYRGGVTGLGTAVDDISYAILTKKLVFVEGEYGQGKTTILKKLINDFGGNKQVVYFSCNRLDGRLDIERLLKKRYGFLGRLFGFEAKDMVLLLDEAQHLGTDDYKSLSEHHKKGAFKSIVFVSPKLNGEANGLTTNALVVNLKKINEEEAVKIVRQRVGHLHLLSDDMIKELFRKSNKNVRELLKNCELVCKYAVDNEMTKVTEGIAEEVLGKEDAKEEEKEEPAKKAAKGPLTKKAAKKAPSKKKEETPETEQPELVETKKQAPEKKPEAPALQQTENLTASQLLDEEDEIDRQVKELAMQGDELEEEAEETPKRRKKAAPQPAQLEPDEETLLPEEDYY